MRYFFYAVLVTYKEEFSMEARATNSYVNIVGDGNFVPSRLICSFLLYLAWVLGLAKVAGREWSEILALHHGAEQGWV